MHRFAEPFQNLSNHFKIEIACVGRRATSCSAGVFAPAELVSVTLSAWAVKVGWEIVALPITLPVVRALKKAESEDYYDVDTNFNPFTAGDKKAVA